jgi:hypothetical protein
MSCFVDLIEIKWISKYMYIVNIINIWIFVDLPVLCKLIREVIFLTNLIIVEHKVC